MTIRPAHPADILAMITLEEQATTAAHWSAEQYEALFRDSNSSRAALVVEEESGVQGFAIARVVGREWEIENIAIAGAVRRCGVGTRLLGALLDLARAQGAEAVFLEVRESNHAARALYEKWNFEEGGRRRRYYQDPPEDAILYRLGFT